MSTRGKVVVAMLLVGLLGCRDGGDSTAPGGAREARVVPASDATPRKAASAGPLVAVALEAEPAVAPEPAVEPMGARAPVVDGSLLRVNDRTVAVRLDEDEPIEQELPPARALVVSIDGATQGDGLLSLPTPFGYCEGSEAVVEPVFGEPSPLVLAQAFCTFGEDEFSREILSAVIHVGDATTAPRVLWQGGGRYGNSFGRCEDIDVPTAEVTRAGVLVIEQVTEVIAYPNPERLGGRCKARKERRRRLAELAF